MAELTQSMVLSTLRQADCCAGELGCNYVSLSENGDYDGARQVLKKLNKLNALRFALNGFVVPGTVLQPEILPYLQVAFFNVPSALSTASVDVDSVSIGSTTAITNLLDFVNDLASEINIGSSGFGAGVDVLNSLPSTIVYFEFTINGVSSPTDSATLNIDLTSIGPYSGAGTPGDFATGFAAFITANSSYYAEANGTTVRVYAIQNSGGIPIGTSISISNDPGLLISSITNTTSVGWLMAVFAPVGSGSGFNGIPYSITASNGVIYQLFTSSPFSGGVDASEPTGEDLCLSVDKAFEIMGAISEICGCNTCLDDNSQGGVSLTFQASGSNIIATESGFILQADV